MDRLSPSDMLAVMDLRSWSKIVLGVYLVALLAGCGTDPLPEEPEEESPAEDSNGVPEVVQTVHPTLTVDTPLAGTYASDDTVLVSGSVEEGSAPLTTLTIGDEEVSIEGGAFAHHMDLEPGPNILGLRLQSEDAGRAVEAVSVFGPSTNPPATTIEEALQIDMGQQFLDNGSSELDDLAGILQALLQDQQFLESFVDEPYEVGEDSFVEVTRIEISDAEIDITAISGCLDSVIVLGAVDEHSQGFMEIDLQATGSSAIFGDEIYLSTRSTRLEAQICSGVTDGELELDIYNPYVSFEEFKLATSDHPDLAEEYPTLTQTVASVAESALEDWIGETVADLVLEMLEQFVASYEFGVDPVVTASFDLADIEIDGAGVRLSASGRFSTPQGLAELPETVGSLRTETTPMTGPISDAPVAVAMSKDALNQLLFALWYGGGFADYDVPTEDLDDLPDVFKPLTSIDVDVWLPPTFMAATEPEYLFDLAVGGVGVDLIAGGDRHFEMGIHLRAGVDIEVDEEGLLMLEIDNRAQRITVQAGVANAPPEHDKGDLAALLRMITPAALGEANVDFEGFPLPAFDLASFSDSLGGFEGRAISFAPSSFSAGGSENAYLIVEGSLREDQQ